MTDRQRGQFEELQERIREVAYLMWEAAGAQHGRALEFWLAAEREVLRAFQSDRPPDGPPEGTPPVRPADSAAGVSTETDKEDADETRGGQT